MNVAFPAIITAFGIPLAEIQWIIVLFIIAQSTCTLIFGKLGDLFGHRRIFRIGLVAAAVAHVALAFAPNYPVLVALRVVQGMAIGIAMACGPALATLIYPAEAKRRILAIYLMCLGVGFVLGPLAGGVMTAVAGWPGVFWFRVPLALVALVLSIGVPEPAVDRARHPSLDYLGALLLTGALTALAFAVGAGRYGYTIAALALLAGGGALVWLFVRQETRFPEPILRMPYFRDRHFASLQLAAVLINLANFSIFLLMPFVLAARADYATFLSGLVLAANPAGAIIANALVESIGRRIDSMRFATIGLATTAVGLIGLGGLITTDTPLAGIGAAFFVTGFGVGLFQIGYSDLTTSILPVADRGVAGSLVNVTRLTGFVFGATGILWLHQAQGGAFARTFVILGAALAIFTLGIKSALATRRTP